MVRLFHRPARVLLTVRLRWVGDGNLTSGWQQYFSASGDGLHPACGDAGIGESKHYTAYNGASMALDFVGEFTLSLVCG